MEEVNSIIETINKHFSLGGGEFVLTDDNGPESFEATEIFGTISGRAVKLTVKKYKNPDVGYGIGFQNLDRVAAPDEGGPLGRGNPERDLDLTASVFQWNGLLADLKNAPLPGA